MNNDRIKLPAQEWLGYDPERGDMHGYTFEQMREFAELIVRECLNQCYNRGMNDELYAGQLRAAAYIEEHFGLEERP